MVKDIAKLSIIFVFGAVFGLFASQYFNIGIPQVSVFQEKISADNLSCAMDTALANQKAEPVAEQKEFFAKPGRDFANVSKSTNSREDHQQSGRFMQIAATRLIDDIGKYTKLSEGQKNEILEKGGQIAREFWSADRNSETLKQILGEDEYRKYNEVLSMQRIKFQQDNIEKEVLFYGRKLRLNEAQENDLRSAFAQAQAQASELAHNSDSSGGDFAANFQQRREQIRNSVLEQMQNGLSAEQLLQLQQEMEASERFWGRW